MSDSAVIALSDPDATKAALTGGKGAHLATMVLAGLPVPGGFVVATAAYRQVIRDHGIEDVIHREMAGLVDGSVALDVVSARLRDAVESAPMPAALREAIGAAYTALGEGAVAVRSSATAEDLPEASFAGQQETVLNVVGRDGLCDAVRRCWSSLWTARAISYRGRQGIGSGDIAVAVVVQKMVPAEAAGVLFTADPVSGRRDRIVVEATAGLGEAVVSGRLTPQRWTIDADTAAVLSGPAHGVLSADQSRMLVELGARTARIFGAPQDIEWAVSQGRCWLLQSRAITSLYPLPPARPGLRAYIPAMLIAQGISEPFTPAGNAYFRSLTTAWITYLTTGAVPRAGTAPPPWLPVVAGRIFIDVTELLQRPRLAARVLFSVRAKDPTAAAALQEWLGENAVRLPRPRRWLPPFGAAATVARIVWAAGVAVAAPGRRRRRLVSSAETELTQLGRQAATRATPAELVDFVLRDLPARTCRVITEQLPAVYAEEILKVLIQRLLMRWLGSSSGWEPVMRWLPNDPTMAMGAELAHLADLYSRAGTEPLANSTAVTDFLSRYGHRAPDREIDMGLPRFNDNPTYVVEMIHGYLGSGVAGEAATRFDTGAAEAREAAQQLVARVRKVKGRTRAALLHDLLNRYRALGGMREQPKFDIVRAIALGRRTLQRAGAALVADGRLAAVDDIFFVDDGGLRAVVAGQTGDLTALAAAGRHEFEREMRRRTVPRLLVSDGETVYGPRHSGKAGPDALVGTAVSPGVHEGVVRILDSPVGAELQRGEILVADTTDPGWTPLFLIAGALVMEVGGVVSHGAVVAREYGIPAVAGIPGVTDRLRTGQRVRVDGGSGTVTILEDVAAAAVTTRD